MFGPHVDLGDKCQTRPDVSAFLQKKQRRFWKSESDVYQQQLQGKWILNTA